MEKFRTWLSERMSERGWNYRRADLARDAKIRASTVSDWFNRDAPPTDEAVWQLARWASTIDRIVEPSEIYVLLGVEPPETYNPLEYRWSLMFSWLRPDDVHRLIHEIQTSHLMAEKYARGKNRVRDAKRKR